MLISRKDLERVLYHHRVLLETSLDVQVVCLKLGFDLKDELQIIKDALEVCDRMRLNGQEVI